MKLQTIRLSNFQSFGPEPIELDLENITYLIGPNGAGKTAVLQGLCRMFALDPFLRRIQSSDFHVAYDEHERPEERSFWIEVDFTFPELLEDSEHPTIPSNFRHMRLQNANGVPIVRFRLSATMGIDGDIEEENLLYIYELDSDGSPLNTAKVPRMDRNSIQIHYLPARRDPADHIAFGANTLLGRLLRAVNWQDELKEIKGFANQISNSLEANTSVNILNDTIKNVWSKLHKGEFFADPKITFLSGEIDSLLRNLTVSFSPGHDDTTVNFSRLSDGQKSILYLSLVLSSQEIGRVVLLGENSFIREKLNPAIFTLVTVEEPENSLSPHYLGRIISSLEIMANNGNAQALIATHAPSLLRRVEPEKIRHLRLSERRQTCVTKIKLPEKTNEAYKFVREAVQAFPEIYFSRLVVLGEGDSEEIVLPRLLKAKGAGIDESGVTVAPLGGRHVNHFWRLLHGLNIPFITVLDLDLGRYQGGWGRVRYVAEQLFQFPTPTCELKRANIDPIPRWDTKFSGLDYGRQWLKYLEGQQVFFSEPLDLDFAMLKAFSEAYQVEIKDQIEPDISQIKAVLGDSYQGFDPYSIGDSKLFITYHKQFKLRSKPATHIHALSKLSDEQLLMNIPPSLNRLADIIISRLTELPE